MAISEVNTLTTPAAAHTQTTVSEYNNDFRTQISRFEIDLPPKVRGCLTQLIQEKTILECSSTFIMQLF